MEIQYYICNSSFPNKIQELLRERGFFIESLPEVHKYTNRIHGAFSFRITKGSDTIRVLGVEDHNEFSFHMVEDPPEGEFSTGLSPEFYDEVEEIMLRNGADLGEIQEL
jgi:hypothetical protein